MPKLLFQGHGSLRLTADDGRVVYIDPYMGKGYDLHADIILVTHQHHDHNQIKRCAQKPGCCIIINAEALANGSHNSFDVGGILIQAVEAGNKNHDPKVSRSGVNVPWRLAVTAKVIPIAANAPIYPVIFCVNFPAVTAMSVISRKVRGLKFVKHGNYGIYNVNFGGSI